MNTAARIDRKSALPLAAVVALAVLLAVAADGRSLAAQAVAPWPVRGNSRSQIYFWAGCENYNTIAERRRMEFPSACAAEAAGFRAAKNCHREIPGGHRGNCPDPPPRHQETR